MAIKLVQPASQVVPRISRIANIMTTHFLGRANHIWTKNTRFGEAFTPVHIIKVAEQNSGFVVDNKKIKEDEKDSKAVSQIEDEKDSKAVSQIKDDLYQAVQGINRGIFGVPSAKKSEIHGLVELLEIQNPTPDPTLNLDKVGGSWKLLYSTVTILGSKKTKLGLRDFISLGDFFQNIDVAESKAVNVIKFNVRGLNMFSGQLSIEASFKISSKSRVEITYDLSTITPDQLMNLFRKNYDLLLGIFNPEGWLEITYVDNNLRVSRDDKGNIFILERSN